MQADQINCLKLLEIWDFGLALASRQPAPVLKRAIWCVFFRLQHPQTNRLKKSIRIRNHKTHTTIN